MITKKCHKLENTLKEEDEKNNKEENNEPKEILIVDVNNNLEESEEEKEEKEGEEQNEKSINYSKIKLSKPKPILNVDSNSINFTDYQVNDNKYSNYNYPNPRYNYYTGSSSSYYLPKSYSFYCNSNYNNGFRTDNFNNLASSNDYTYKYRNSSNPYGINRNNSYIGYNVSKNTNNNNYPYTNNNDNHSITYSFYSQQKPNNLRSRSFVKLKNKYNIDDKVDNFRNSKGNNLSISQRTIPYERYNDGTQNNFYPTKERVTYVLNYYKNNIGSNFNNKNNTYRAYNKSLPYKLNYNYIFN
jgi:hypothetical protein